MITEQASAKTKPEYTRLIQTRKSRERLNKNRAWLFISGNEPYQLCTQNVYDLFGKAPPFQEEGVQLQCFAHEPSIYDF